MKNKTSDLWLNMYVFLLLPFCILINICNLFKYIKHFNSLDNMFVTIDQLVLCVLSIIIYSITIYYAKDRVKKAYYLLLISVLYSILVASFNQTLNTYYDQGLKAYMMFSLYVLLFICCYGLPNLLYFYRRKEMFYDKERISKEELKQKINEAMKKKNGKK